METIKTIHSIIVVLTFLGGSPCHTCEIGWFRGYGNSCYYFSRFATNFYTALNFCKTYGGTLVEIDNSAEFSLLSQMIRARRFPDFYIGVTDMFSEGYWQKATTLGKQNYRNWYYSEPNNLDNNQHCVQVWSNKGMQWDDLWCWYERHFVCEK